MNTGCIERLGTKSQTIGGFLSRKQTVDVFQNSFENLTNFLSKSSLINSPKNSPIISLINSPISSPISYMNIGLKSVVFTLIFIFLSFKVMAQTLEEQRLASKSPWNFLNDFTMDSNAQDLNAVDNSSGLTYTTGFRYSLSPKRNLWAFASASKRFTGEERLDPLNTIIRLEQVLDQKVFSMSTRARVDAILPTNEFIHEQTSFVGGLGLQLRFTKVLPYRLFFIWNNNLRWNFHNFRVSEIGVPNIQTNLSTLLNLSFAATPKIQTSLGLGWSLARSYENTLTDFYSIDIGASYVITNEWSIAGGWTTAGSPFTADGQSSNIKLFDERDTTYYLSLTHFM